MFFDFVLFFSFLHSSHYSIESGGKGGSDSSVFIYILVLFVVRWVVGRNGVVVVAREGEEAVRGQNDNDKRRF